MNIEQWVIWKCGWVGCGGSHIYGERVDRVSELLMVDPYGGSHLSKDKMYRIIT